MPAPNKKEDVWKRIKQGAPDECWPWMGSCDTSGYGLFGYGGKRWKAHRMVMALRGIDLTGKDAMHSCDNPPCCNPAHLRAGTRTENNLDAVKKGRWPQGRGASNVNATLTDERVREMRQAWAELPRHPTGVVKWRETAKAAKRLGVTDRLLYRVGTRQVWKHVP